MWAGAAGGAAGRPRCGRRGRGCASWRAWRPIVEGRGAGAGSRWRGGERIAGGAAGPARRRARSGGSSWARQAAGGRHRRRARGGAAPPARLGGEHGRRRRRRWGRCTRARAPWDAEREHAQRCARERGAAGRRAERWVCCRTRAGRLGAGASARRHAAMAAACARTSPAVVGGHAPRPPLPPARWSAATRAPSRPRAAPAAERVAHDGLRLPLPGPAPASSGSVLPRATSACAASARRIARTGARPGAEGWPSCCRSHQHTGRKAARSEATGCWYWGCAARCGPMARLSSGTSAEKLRYTRSSRRGSGPAADAAAAAAAAAERRRRRRRRGGAAAAGSAASRAARWCAVMAVSSRGAARPGSRRWR